MGIAGSQGRQWQTIIPDLTTAAGDIDNPFVPAGVPDASIPNTLAANPIIRLDNSISGDILLRAVAYASGAVTAMTAAAIRAFGSAEDFGPQDLERNATRQTWENLYRRSDDASSYTPGVTATDMIFADRGPRAPAAERYVGISGIIVLDAPFIRSVRAIHQGTFGATNSGELDRIELQMKTVTNK